MTAAAAIAPAHGFLASAEERVRTRLFGGSRSPFWRVGAEIELLALTTRDWRAVPIHGAVGDNALLPILREAGASHRWRETLNGCGIPCFVIPGVGVLSFEPGGQVEVSTRPFTAPSALLIAMREIVQLLQAIGRRSGVTFLEIGLDPVNGLNDVPLAFGVPRYERMAAHFSRIGGDGLRMMRQTASCQVSIDVARADVAETWLALNALAPFAIAAFANSPFSEGRATGIASNRARIWQNTDRSRTGVFTGHSAPEEYMAFALDAVPFLPSTASAETLRRVVARGAITPAGWSEHLSTLFPEVRPRGYMEFRACDMVGEDARAALLVLLCAVARDAHARARIREIAGEPDRLKYAAAPFAPADLLSAAAAAGDVALHSARREPEGFWSADDLFRAERFFSEHTSAGRAPASGLALP